MAQNQQTPRSKSGGRNLGVVGGGALAALLAGAFLTSETIDASDDEGASPPPSASARTEPAPAAGEGLDIETAALPVTVAPAAADRPAEPPLNAAAIDEDDSPELEAEPQIAENAPSMAVRTPQVMEVSRPVKMAQKVLPAPEIVVKFKDETGAKEISDLFWKDKSAARAKFDALKAQSPTLRTLSLDRVTYSGEMVLVHEGGVTPDRMRRAMQEAARRLKSDPNVSYAEPNATAQPGTD